MDNKKIIEIINDLELRFDVSKIKYKSIKVWPLIRLYITRELFHNNYGGNNVGEQLNIQSFLKSIYIALKYYIIFYLNHIKNSVKLTSFNSCDIVLISRTSDRTEAIECKSFNRICDSLSYFLKDEYDIRIFEYSNSENYNNQPYFKIENIDSEIINAKNKVKALKKLSTIKKVFSKGKNKQINEVASYLHNKYGIQFDLERNTIDAIISLSTYKNIMYRILKKCRPKCVFMVCFYDIISMATVLACKELKIDSVEVQHGQQGDYHPMYSHWKNFPLEGYEILPRKFWVWGQKSSERLKAWCINSNQHEVIIGGNPWIIFWKNTSASLCDFNTQESEKFNTQKKNILLTLQPKEDPIPLNIINSIKKTQNSVNWHIRLHPRMLNRKGWIEEILFKNGCTRYEIDYSSKMPLFSIFKYINLHITLWSTVAYEALAFGIPSIIAHKNGYEQMKDYCDNNYFYYAESEDEIVKYILDNNNSKLEENVPYIVSSLNILKNTVSELLVR